MVLNHGRLMFDGDPYFATEELRKILGTDVPIDAPDIVPDAGIAFGNVRSAPTPVASRNWISKVVSRS